VAFMMAKFVLILYVPGIPAVSMSDIDFDFGGVSTQGKHKKLHTCSKCLHFCVDTYVTLLLFVCLFIF
jgi:hypothetical protein